MHLPINQQLGHRQRFFAQGRHLSGGKKKQKKTEVLEEYTAGAESSPKKCIS
jgi:hypothetical protein